MRIGIQQVGPRFLGETYASILVQLALRKEPLCHCVTHRACGSVPFGKAAYETGWLFMRVNIHGLLRKIRFKGLAFRNEVTHPGPDSKATFKERGVRVCFTKAYKSQCLDNQLTLIQTKLGPSKKMQSHP